jgi:flagellar hook-basal body complex protein FliE
MNPIEALQAIGAPAGDLAVNPIAAPETPGTQFIDLVSDGVQQVDDRVTHAQDMVRAFAVDSSIPIHQVTIALEEARLAVELALQVRSRVVEGYRDLMNTQL